MFSLRRFGLSLGRRLPGLLLLSFLPLVAQALGQGQATDWPAHPIKMIVPFPANGPTDVVARIIARQASIELGQPVEVHNAPGAGGTLGVAEAAAAQADGYTLLLTTTSTHSVSPHLFRAFSYDVKTDFTPIAHLGSAGSVLLVAPQLPVKSLAELIAYAKERPGKLGYGSSGSGTIVHLMSEALSTQAGIKMAHFTYRGTGQAREDLKQGMVQVLLDSIPTGMPYVQRGELRALAVTRKERSPLMPDIPTLAEAGLPGMEFTTWFGLYTSAGLPEERRMRLYNAFTSAIQNSDTALRLRSLGVAPAEPHTPAEFANMVEADSERWKQIIETVNITTQ